MAFYKDGTETVLQYDASGNKVFLQGTTLPSAIAGYSKGAIFLKTDVAGGTGGTYLNKGTTASCTFTLVTQA